MSKNIQFDVNKLKNAADTIKETDIQESAAIIEKVGEGKGRVKIYKDGRPSHMPKRVSSRKLTAKTSNVTIELTDAHLKGNSGYLNRSHFIEMAILEKLEKETGENHISIKKRHWWFKDKMTK